MKTFLRQLCCLCWLVLGAVQARAEEPPPPQPDTAGQFFATVWRLRGDVFASLKASSPRKLREGDTIVVGEQVRAGANGEAVLKTGDAGLVALRSGAEFAAERFAAEGKASDHQTLRLVVGSLRVISGWIGQINRKDNTIITNTSTIGIRGTDHEPYVLAGEMVSAVNPAGTYDKVNRGSTLLQAQTGSVEIEPGGVGFARDPNAPGVRKRALMTLLFPVLLDKVPAFYVPGAFESEINLYSEQADALSRQQLESLTGVAPTGTGCVASALGGAWLARLDAALAQRDAAGVLALFAPNMVARATVRQGERMVTLEFEREEMTRSTLRSIASLQDYQQHRVSVQAAWADGQTQTNCQRINVRSVVIEQGLMNGKPYRFESLEEYVLAAHDGQWQAISAHTTQR